MGKHIIVDYTVCDPARCDPANGICAAARACKHKLLVQEEAGESPMLLSQKMCVGCSDCTKACPLQAVKLQRGNY